MIAARPTLRDYQAELVGGLRSAFRGGARSVLCVLPTGGGKTVVACEVVHGAVAKGRRVLVLAHRVELIDQMSGKLDQFGIPHGVIKSGHPRVDPTAPVQVASVQTLARRLAKKRTAEPEWDGSPSAADDQGRFGLIVCDECHHIAADSYQTILDADPSAPVLGMTATPYRLDGKGLGETFTTLVGGPQIPELIRGGFLVQPRVLAPPAAAALQGLRSTAGDFAMGQAASILDARAPLTEIVQTWQRRAHDRLTVAFACTVEHAEHLAEAFRSAGVSSVAVDGTTAAGEREARLAAFAAGQVRVLVNCNLLTEGWDVPHCAAAILARPTKSRAMWRQQVGRALRSAPGKGDALILDHVGAVHRFGLPDEVEEWTLDDVAADEGEQQALCPACCAVLPATDEAPLMHCAICGAALPQSLRVQRGPRDNQGTNERHHLELGQVRAKTPEERRSIYWSLLRVARDRQYSEGWAAHRYRDRFGGYPPQPWRDQYEMRNR